MEKRNGCPNCNPGAPEECWNHQPVLRKYVVSATYTEVRTWHVLAESPNEAVEVLAHQDGSGKEVDVYIPCEPDYEAREFVSEGLRGQMIWDEERQVVQITGDGDGDDA